MITSSSRARTLTTTPLAWAVSAALAAAAAMPAAAVAADEAEAESTLEDIVVTGSRIVVPNQSSSSPVVSVTSRDIQLTGRNDISDLINNLPQIVNNSLGQGLSNRTSGLSSAGGVATADLRGLGPNRTLVLVDGIRLGQGSPQTAIASPGPDLDQIPAPLVERIDVLTGGASAVYGSDAIAGVMNFVLKKDFEGFQVDAQFGGNRHKNDNAFVRRKLADIGEVAPTGTVSDGRNLNVSMVAGTNLADGRGNITAYLGFQRSDPVSSGSRDFGACQLGLNDDLNDVDCTGSVNSNWFEPKSGPNAAAGAVYAVKGSNFIEWGSAETSPPPAFNSQKYIYIGRDNKRYQGGVIGHVEMSEQVKPYFQLFVMNDRSFQEIAPSGLFRDGNVYTNDGTYLVNCSNPLLSAQQAAALCTPQQIAADAAAPGSASARVRIGRRNVEGGGRQSSFEHTNYRAVLGTKGNFGKAWSYDLYGQYFYTTFFNSNDRYLSLANVSNALQVTGTRANPRCIGGGTCVPWNIFSDGGVTEAALNYLYLPGTAAGNVQMRTLHADVSGNLGEYGLKSPFADEGLAFNVGFEQRRDAVEYRPDAAQLSGDLSGTGGASVAIDNAIRVREGFAEIRVPLVQGKTGVEDLVFGAGYRRSDYSTIGAVNTYKFELQYSPIEDVRFRGSFNHAIRAPGIIELYNPQLVGNITVSPDPCAPIRNGTVITPPTATLQQCLNTVSEAQRAAFTAAYNAGQIPQGTASQLSQLQGGNPNLTSEEADTYTVGVTVTPSIVPNLTASIDYFRIKLKNVVGVFPAGTIINGCLNTGDAKYCSQIVRSPTNFGLTGATVQSGGYIVQTSVNIGAGLLSGIDLQTGYRMDLPAGLGNLALSLNGSYLDKSETNPAPGLGTYDCAGLFGPVCQTINPRWRHSMRAAWTMPFDVTAALTWRYLGPVKLDNNTGDPQLASFTDASGRTVQNLFNPRIGSYSYLDLAATWNVRESLELRVGVNNLLDKDPPLVSSELTSGGAANTYETYDPYGRQWFAAFTAKF
jgi:outer membrane receptor protein involved in Fe transport